MGREVTAGSGGTLGSLGPNSPRAEVAGRREAPLLHQARERQQALPLKVGWVGVTVRASPEP